MKRNPQCLKSTISNQNSWATDCRHCQKLLASGKTPGGWSLMVISYPPRVRFAELYWLRDKAVFWKTKTNKLIITITKITIGKVQFVRRSHWETSPPASQSRMDMINKTQSNPSPTSWAFGTSPRITPEGRKTKKKTVVYHLFLLLKF